MEPRESPPQLLEALVDMVAALGELVATVTAPHRSVQPSVYPRSLFSHLRTFTWSIRNTLRDITYLEQRDVSYLQQRNVTYLGQALATLGATPGATWADVTAAFTAWRWSVDVLMESWFMLVWGAEELTEIWEDEATTEATAQARNLQDQATGRGTAGDTPVASAQQPSVALAEEEVASAVAEHDAQVAAAPEAREETVVATRQAGVASRRGQQAKVAKRLLWRLGAMCQRARALPLELHRRLKDIEATLKGTREVSTNVPEALVAAVAEAEQLWEASARLTRRHLLGALGDIHRLLVSRPCGPGGAGGSCVRAVAERCQKAIKDIPRLLVEQ
ncbi:uncharacterized protein FYW23_014593 isoform 2-T5 [Sylvia borin]